MYGNNIVALNNLHCIHENTLKAQVSLMSLIYVRDISKKQSLEDKITQLAMKMINLQLNMKRLGF